MRINEKIRVNKVRLIDENNQQLGVISAYDAQAKANEAGLDLVEVSPNAEPPVCRIMDYGKWLYQQKRNEKKANKKQHNVTLKEVRLRPEIDVHDRDIKVEQAKKFLEKGHRVQFTMMFRGREMMHQDHGREIFSYIIEYLGSVGKVERAAEMAGRRMTMVIMPAK